MRVRFSIGRWLCVSSCLALLAVAGCDEAVAPPPPYSCLRAGSGDGGVESASGGCTEYVAGYSDNDIGSVCAVPNTLRTDTACPSGWTARCEVSILGRDAISYWYASDRAAAARTCTTLGGTLTER